MKNQFIKDKPEGGGGSYQTLLKVFQFHHLTEFCDNPTYIQ